jgi:hypothetical protein
MTRWEDELVGKIGNDLIDQFANRGEGNKATWPGARLP